MNFDSFRPALMNDLVQDNQPLESIHALLTGAIDYAGLFPPSQLSMEDAVVNVAKYRASEHSWMLGRFVVPVARLDELRETAGGGTGTARDWCA